MAPGVLWAPPSSFLMFRNPPPSRCSKFLTIVCMLGMLFPCLGTTLICEQLEVGHLRARAAGRACQAAIDERPRPAQDVAPSETPSSADPSGETPRPGGRNHTSPKTTSELDDRVPPQLGLFPNLPAALSPPPARSESVGAGAKRALCAPTHEDPMPLRDGPRCTPLSG